MKREEGPWFAVHRGYEIQIMDANDPFHRTGAIRGLWVRNGRFYAQMRATDPNNGRKSVRRIPLEGAVTTGEAVKAMNKLKVQREENQLPVLRQTPYYGRTARQVFRVSRKG